MNYSETEGERFALSRLDSRCPGAVPRRGCDQKRVLMVRFPYDPIRDHEWSRKMTGDR